MNEEKTTVLKKCLYLDDIRTPKNTIDGYEPWNIVRNYDEFIKWVADNGVPDLISFDHDLATEHMNDFFSQTSIYGFQYPTYETYKEKTGLDCAKWLCKYIQDNNLILKKCSVHSHNPVGGENIKSYINGFKKHMGWNEDCFFMEYPFKIVNK